MSRLTQNSQAAERLRGCAFAETFEDSNAVTKNGGAISGTPVVNMGINLNGTTDYVIYALSGQEFNSASITMLIEFTPDFDPEANETIRFLNGTNVNISKGNDGDFNRIRLSVGGTSLGGTTFATYGPYWNDNARNVLVFSCTSGNNEAWLNGTAMPLTGAATAWTPNADTSVTLGANAGGGSLWFDGVISKVLIFQQKLTAQEAVDYSNNTTFNYRNKAILDLPMGMAQHDVTNTRSLDVSGNGLHSTWVAGATVPTKLVQHGYSFDGGDRLVGAATGIFESLELGIIMEFKPDFATDENAVRYLFASTAATDRVLKHNNANNNILNIAFGGTTIISIAEATYSPFWKVGQYNILIVSATSGDSNAWLNGNQIVTNDTTVYTAAAAAQLGIGASSGGSSPFDGDIYRFTILPQTITPLQMYDALVDFRKKINDV